MNNNLTRKDKTSTGESLKVSAFRKHIRKTEAHRHNSYFELIYLTQGAGIHSIDNREFGIQPPVVFTVRQEQVHCWDITSEPDGFVLIIKKEFVENCIDRDIKRLIGELSSHACLFPEDDSATDIFSLLVREHHSEGKSKAAVVEGLLKALLAKLLGSALPQTDKGAKSQLLGKFMELLEQEGRPFNRLNHFAEWLNTTPQNLNAICRKQMGRSATEVQAEHIISEAKRQLTYTDRTVSEISFALGFNDPSHFVKYFKRHTQATPQAFRNGK